MRKFKQLGIIIFIQIIILSALNAQHRVLEGYVTERDGKPLPNALVVPRGTDLSATTDNVGYFMIEGVPDTILTLSVTHPEKEPASATIGIYDRIDVVMVEKGFESFLDMSLEELLNIKVTTVSKSDENISDAPGVISVLTKDEINRFGGTTLKDLLERMPGLIGSTVYMTDRSTIAARGDQVLASSSHVLLLINGRPVREALEGGIKGEMYESFPINIIEKIEVIRGPGSVLYGSNAFSAVINVITKTSDANHVSISGMGGLPGDYGLSGEAIINAGDFGITLAGRYMKKQNWETDWQYANPMSPSGETTTGISIPDEGLGTYLGMKYKNLRLMASYNEWENYYFVPDYAFIFPAHGNANWKKGFVNLGYDINVSENWDMDLNATYTRSTFATQNWPNTNRDSYEAVGEWTNFYNPIEKLGIVFGGLFNYFEGEEWGPSEDSSGKEVFTDANRYSVGAYTQLNYSILSNLNLIGGVQINKVEDIDLNLVPRAGLIWYPVSRLNVKAFYSEAFRAPSINEFSINFSAMQGNPNLTPEKVSTFDVGIGYQGDQFHAGINFFYSQMKDLIFQNRDTTEVPVPMYWNGAAVDFMGIEIEGKYYINRQWYVTGSLLFQTNEDKDGNENVSPISNIGIKSGISYKSRTGITASLFNIYQGSLDEFYDTELNPSPGAYNLLSAYLNFDLVNLLNINAKQGLSLFVQGNNLLNQEIWLPAWGLSPGQSIPRDNGLTLYFGIKATL